MVCTRDTPGRWAAGGPTWRAIGVRFCARVLLRWSRCYRDGVLGRRAVGEIHMSVSIHRLLVLLIATAAGVVLAAGEASALDEARPACAGLEPGPTRTVTRILDGETVALDDGTELRLIGALAPRAIDAGAEPGTWPAEIAATRGAARAAARQVRRSCFRRRAQRPLRPAAGACLNPRRRRPALGAGPSPRAGPGARLYRRRQSRLRGRTSRRRARRARGPPRAVGRCRLPGAAGGQAGAAGAQPQHVPAGRGPHRRRRAGARHDLSQLRCRLAARVLGRAAARRSRSAGQQRRQSEGAAGQARARARLDRAAQRRQPPPPPSSCRRRA